MDTRLNEALEFTDFSVAFADVIVVGIIVAEVNFDFVIAVIVLVDS